MDRIVEAFYIVSHQDSRDVGEEVERFIGRGWQPWGSVAMTQENGIITYAQAVVLYKKQ